MHLYKLPLPKKKRRLKKNQLRKKRKKNQKKNPMKIWDLAYLTKLLLSNTTVFGEIKIR